MWRNLLLLARMWIEEFRTLLRDCLEQGKSRNPAFSQRALARKAEISPGTLSEFMSGKKALSPATALQICQRLGLENDKVENLKVLIQEEARPQKRLVLSKEDTRILEQWHVLPLLCFLELRNPPEPEEIAEKLGLPQEELLHSIFTLEKIGLVRRDNSKWRATRNYFSTPSDVRNEWIQRFHQQNLTEVQKRFTRIPVEDREVISVHFAGNPLQIQRAKKDMRNFVDKMERNLSRSGKEKVYQLSLQLIPID